MPSHRSGLKEMFLAFAAIWNLTFPIQTQTAQAQQPADEVPKEARPISQIGDGPIPAEPYTFTHFTEHIDARLFPEAEAHDSLYQVAHSQPINNLGWWELFGSASKQATLLVTRLDILSNTGGPESEGISHLSFEEAFELLLDSQEGMDVYDAITDTAPETVLPVGRLSSETLPFYAAMARVLNLQQSSFEGVVFSDAYPVNPALPNWGGLTIEGMNSFRTTDAGYLSSVLLTFYQSRVTSMEEIIRSFEGEIHPDWIDLELSMLNNASPLQIPMETFWDRMDSLQHAPASVKEQAEESIWSNDKLTAEQKAEAIDRMHGVFTPEVIIDGTREVPEPDPFVGPPAETHQPDQIDEHPLLECVSCCEDCCDNYARDLQAAYDRYNDAVRHAEDEWRDKQQQIQDDHDKEVQEARDTYNEQRIALTIATAAAAVGCLASLSNPFTWWLAAACAAAIAAAAAHAAIFKQALDRKLDAAEKRARERWRQASQEYLHDMALAQWNLNDDLRDAANRLRACLTRHRCPDDWCGDVPMPIAPRDPNNPDDWDPSLPPPQPLPLPE